MTVTYEDLADPAWADKIFIRSSSNIYNQPLVASMIAADGLEAAEDWANGIVANLVRKPQGDDTDQTKAVAAGECDVAVANHYYLARLMRSDKAEDKDVAAAVDIIFPNQDGRGAHANVSVAGVAAHAPNKDAAVEFIEFLETPDAQAYFADGNNEWPAVQGVKLSPVLEAWGGFTRPMRSTSARSVKTMPMPSKPWTAPAGNDRGAIGRDLARGPDGRPRLGMIRDGRNVGTG